MELEDKISDIKRIINDVISKEDFQLLIEIVDPLTDEELQNLGEIDLFKAGATFNYYKDYKRAARMFEICLSVYGSEDAKAALINLKINHSS